MYVILIIILVVFVLWRKIRNIKSANETASEKEVNEPKISYVPILQNEEKEIAETFNLFYDFEILSITQKGENLELLLNFVNHSNQTIRIDLQKALYHSISLQKSVEADSTFYGELNMGTNDILLKNTILPGANVIRNVYFFNLTLNDFNQNDSIEVNLVIENQLYKLKKFLHESKLDRIKVIE